jgi:hypothetical protein
MIEPIFAPGQWIWSAALKPNQYVLFVKTIEVESASTLRIRISASTHYELWINGEWIARGPVHGDPQWCQYDELEYSACGGRLLHIAVLVHHEDAYVHCVLPAPGGLIASFEYGNQKFATDESWRCFDLKMWSQDVARRNWALGYGEDYDAAYEPTGWQNKIFDTTGADWTNAAGVSNSRNIWSNYQLRMTPHLERRLVVASTFDAWCAPGDGAESLADVSRICDEEELLPVASGLSSETKSINTRELSANAFTFDLGREHVGFYFIDIEAPPEQVIEISGAEMLRDGRPWIYRKGTSYSARYRTVAGRQQFTTFGWSGFRYLHIVVRGDAPNVTIHATGCLERKAPLQPSILLQSRATDDELQNIFDLCRCTLEVGVQEHLIDCPTREQAQYWGDAVFIAQSLWQGWDERSYLEWILECFIHAPFRPDGQLSSVYPGNHHAFPDYSLIPLLGQQFYKKQTGEWYQPQQTFEKAMRLKEWYDARLNSMGLVDFDFESYKANGVINFIDHPGLGWHNFPHVGIDRDGASCPLNLFYYGFLQIVAAMARDLGNCESEVIRAQADALGQAILQEFFDGEVLHDASKNGQLSSGTSWQTNCLAVYFGLISGEQATNVMRTMLERYDSVCRCSPYFYFFFLPALRIAGLEEEARVLIQREWQPMIDGGATTTWEGFLGDAKDTLCHPWSTAPFLFLLESTATRSTL